MRVFLLFVTFVLSGITNCLHAQWTLQDSHSTASLRGIHYVGNGIAWASGSGGIVLRTIDMGAHWQTCTVPDGETKLDFRGVQAFDADTAIVMSSGTGDLSRLYKTTDGCKTWKLAATNPDKQGFWDAVKSDSEFVQGGDRSADSALILGDSVNGESRVWEWKEGWQERELELLYTIPKKAEANEGSFAASNSVLQTANTPQMDKTWKYSLRWASNTPQHSYISYVRAEHTPICEPCRMETGRIEVPMGNESANAGVFSFDFRNEMVGVAVGGNYSKPYATVRLAAYTSDGGQSWIVPATSPRGYRSSVAYDVTAKEWITVGPNGTDISTDDGRNWRPLMPGPNDALNADKNWNALSLPFVVGTKGRIGILQDERVEAPTGRARP